MLPGDLPELILASASPQRRSLLASLGVAFEVRVPPHEEPADRPSHLTPVAWAEYLACFKAESTAALAPDCWVLGADTLVICGDEIFGKPRDRDHAARMLIEQARRPTDVVTGVCLVRWHKTRLLDHAVTRVWMREDARVREAYLASGDWREKAGAYGIQTVGEQLVERREGSFSNVVGLPLELIATWLKRAGFAPKEPDASLSSLRF